MAFTTAAVILITSVGLAGARSSSTGLDWLYRTRIPAVSASATSPTTLSAKWSPMYWAASYDLTYSGTNLPNPVVLHGITRPSQSVGSLIPRGTYSVRVRAVRKSLQGEWSRAIQVTMPASVQTGPTTPPTTTTTVVPTTAATTTTAAPTTTVATPTTAAPTTAAPTTAAPTTAAPTTAAPTTAAPTTAAPTTTAPTTTAPAPPAPSTGSGPCRLSGAAFCETFDAPHNSGTRTGDLDPVLWGVSRVGVTNPSSMLNDMPLVSMTGCGTTAWVPTPNDVRICNGQLYETVNDGGNVVNLDTYPKQPFDFAGRTGKVTFDVSADSDGSHGAWPEFVITDKPVPGVRSSISGQTPAGAANSIGFALDGGCGINGKTGVGLVFLTKNYQYDEPSFTTPNCITKGSAQSMNHFEVRISQNRLEVWGTDAGSTTLKQLAVADNLGLTLTKGLVWLNDVHYNARKAVEPCECGTQWNHTFVWDNLGFDGPKTYRDLGFDVADANVPGERTGNGDSARRVGYGLGTGPLTLNVDGVRRDQTPTGALFVLNTYSFAQTVPSISINGNPYITTAWPSGWQTYAWGSIAIPIPLDQVHDGTNTVTLKSGDGSTLVSNMSIILVAASPVP